MFNKKVHFLTIKPRKSNRISRIGKIHCPLFPIFSPLEISDFTLGDAFVMGDSDCKGYDTFAVVEIDLKDIFGIEVNNGFCRLIFKKISMK